MRLQYAFAAVLLAGSAAVQAAGVEVMLSNETAQFTGFTDASATGYGGVEFEGGLFLNEDDDWAAHLGFMVQGAPRSQQPFSFSVGAKAYYLDFDAEDADAQALAIGGGAAYHFPGTTPMSLGAQIFYAPDITTGGDADRLVDASLRFAVEVVPGTSGFVGYRLLEAGAEHGGDDYELDENLHIGLRVTF